MKLSALAFWRKAPKPVEAPDHGDRPMTEADRYRATARVAKEKLDLKEQERADAALPLILALIAERAALGYTSLGAGQKYDGVNRIAWVLKRLIPRLQEMGFRIIPSRHEIYETISWE